MTWFGPGNRAFSAPAAAPALPTRFQYQNGAVNTADFPNDFSFSISENFAYTTNPSPGNTQSLLVTQTGAGGGYQPATDFNHPPYGIDVSAYTGFTFAIRVQSTGPFQIFCHDINDVNIAAAINNLTEIAALPLNTWVTLTFPLALIGCWGKRNYYKHCIRSNRGTSGDIIQLDSIGFVPGVSGFIERGSGVLEAGWTDASSNATANYAFDPRTLNAGTGTGADGLYALSGSVPPPPFPQSTPVPSKPMLALTVTSTGGQWRANYAGGYGISAFNYFSFGAIPTKTGHAYLVQLYNTSGVAVGNAVNPAAYCPEDPGISTSQFAVYAIPLSAFGTLPASIGGVSIQDTSGQTTNLLYISNAGFFSLAVASSGSLVHAQAFTVTGAGFGTKVGHDHIWDDCSGSSPQAIWDQVRPDGSGATFNTAYRTPAAQGRGIALPHSNVTKYICGAHNPGRGPTTGSIVNIERNFTKPAGVFYSRWSFWDRYDLNWNFGAGQGDNNHKIYGLGKDFGGILSGGDGTQSWYIEYGQAGDSFSSPTDQPQIHINDDSAGGGLQFWGNMAQAFGNSTPNPVPNWVKKEIIVKWSPTNNGGFIFVSCNNVTAYSQVGATDKYPGTDRTEGINSYSGHDNANNFRYWCDVYYDRGPNDAAFYLTNNADYASSTICEAQHWTLWADGSATLKCNKGTLSSGTVHLHLRSDLMGNQYLGPRTIA